jgi:hypothetical protein
VSSQQDIARILAQSGVEFGSLDPDRVKPDELRDLPREEIGNTALTAKEVLRAVCLAEPPSENSLVDPELARVMENVGLIYGTYYVAAMETLVEIKDDALSKGLIHPEAMIAIDKKRDELEGFVVDEEEVPFYRAQGMLAWTVGQLFGAWWIAALIRHSDNARGTSLIASARAEAMMNASILSDLRLVLSKEAPGLAMLLEGVTSRTLDGLADAMRSESQGVNVADVGYDALRLGDLNQLARRDAAIRESYDMTLERAFERQLSLLFTSLGMAVIESTPGRRYVDLVCIGSDPQPQTLVVEAKSTSRPKYEFRADDQRALVQHVEEVIGTLRGLPRVELVLLIAPGFSNGAASRIREVEQALHVPCRGIESKFLIELRQRHLGPISSTLLIDELQRGDVIARLESIDAILERTTAPTRGWQEFVNVIRKANSRRR